MFPYWHTLRFLAIIIHSVFNLIHTLLTVHTVYTYLIITPWIHLSSSPHCTLSQSLLPRVEVSRRQIRKFLPLSSLSKQRDLAWARDATHIPHTSICVILYTYEVQNQSFDNVLFTLTNYTHIYHIDYTSIHLPYRIGLSTIDSTNNILLSSWSTICTFHQQYPAS